jgi:hypothetical protein
MRIPLRSSVQARIAIPAALVILLGLGTAAQASSATGSGSAARSPKATPADTTPPTIWEITGAGTPYYTHGRWRDCAKVSPTPGFHKSYSCGFTGTIGNSYSATIGVSAEGVSASVGYSVTYSTSITGSTTYTPDNQKTARGEVQWTSQYLTRKVYEKEISGPDPGARHTGYANHWNQPITRFVPSGKIILVSDNGRFSKKHWKCKKRCP